MKPFTSLIIQALAAILTAVLLMTLAPNDAVAMPYLWLLFGFGATYLGTAPFIPKFLEKTGDSFYLVFMGISGMRFLFFMAILSLILVFQPEIKSTALTLILTGWFIAALAIEVWAFMTNLRPNSKKQS